MRSGTGAGCPNQREAGLLGNQVGKRTCQLGMTAEDDNRVAPNSASSVPRHFRVNAKKRAGATSTYIVSNFFSSS